MNPTSISASSATWLVARREIKSLFRSKAFVISSAILIVVVFALAVVSGIIAGRATAPSAVAVAVTPETSSVITHSDALEPIEVTDTQAAITMVEDGDAEAALIPADGPLGYRIVADTEVPVALQWATTLEPEVELLDPDDSDEEFGVNYLISMVMGVIFMMSVITFGSTIAQNTVVEKQTRTVELLVSTVSARVLLAGKILGNSLLAIAQTAAVVVAAILGLLVTGQDEMLSLLSVPMLWFVLFFVFGFVFYAAIFAAAASLVSRIEDTGSVLTPVTMLAITPYFVVILFGQNPLIMQIASYVPFTSVVAMPVRMLGEGVPWWEPLLALAVLVVSDYLVILAAARIYQSSVLRTGKRMKLREAWAGDKP